MTDHKCGRCGGEGTPYPSSPTLCGIDCGTCGGDGRCDGYIDSGTGECALCGWSYEPAEPDYNAPREDVAQGEGARYG